MLVAAGVAFPARGLLDVETLDGGFDAGEAPEPPGGVGDLLDELVFECVDGPEVGTELVEFALVVGGVFAGDDGMPGTEAVLDGVL